MCVCARATNPRVCACASLPPSRGSLTLLFHAPALIPTLSLHIHHYRAVLGLSTVYYRVGGGAPRVGSHTRHTHTHTCTQSHHTQTSNPHMHTITSHARACLYVFIFSLTHSSARPLTPSPTPSITHVHTHTEEENGGPHQTSANAVVRVRLRQSCGDLTRLSACSRKNLARGLGLFLLLQAHGINLVCDVPN